MEVVWSIVTTDRADGEGGESLQEHARRCHEHLSATAELPIDPRTNRWLGEAEAVARDAATSDLDDGTIRKRLRQVAHLLDEADETGHDAADDHLAAAREACDRALEGR